MREIHMKKAISIFFRVLFIVLFLTGCTTSGGGKTGLPKDSQLKIIDAHTHCVFNNTREKTSNIMQSKEEYLKEMTDHNVVGAVAHTGYLGDFYEDLKERNVIFCYGVGDEINEKEIDEALKSGKYGCVKIYLGYIHRYAFDDAYKRIFKIAETYDVPVVFHTGDTYSAKAKLKYADPMSIDEVAVDHPKVRFVIAHCGNPWIHTAAEVAYKNANVYLDLSGIIVGDLDQNSRENVDNYLVKPIGWIFNYVGSPSKILYGSDWPLVNMGQYIQAIKKAIPEEHWKAVFHDNAVNVFKLK
jgi:hypothetical protein